ncbi:MAG: hypothetical protein ACI9JN_001173 [Bacteroidia bacterium]|jgi:hypothetical protein
MKVVKLLLVVVLSAHITITCAQAVITNVGTLPESVSNNAVCAGKIQQIPYLFSFAGIDSTKKYNGIHLRSFRYNLTTGKSERIPDLPDTLGKIACGVSCIGGIAFISGGYHVFANGNEKSSNKMHRYDIINNSFLSDGPNIPIATDDHVQAVWRDSLIFLITGWSDNSNIPNVQIYNPTSNQWQTGTSVPNNNAYKSFGASGVIVKDTIFYFGGASSGTGFKIQSWLRRGIINPNNPAEITWSFSSPNPSAVIYRGASIVVKQQAHWVGGSANTYNYNGIAYDGSGGVAPSNKEYTWTGSKWDIKITQNIPMDLRGIAVLNDTIAYVAGGMASDQRVSSAIYKLYWGDKNAQNRTLAKPTFQVYPNPFKNYILTKNTTALGHIEVFNSVGQPVSVIIDAKHRVSTKHLPSGFYHVIWNDETGSYIRQMIKL